MQNKMLIINARGKIHMHTGKERYIPRRIDSDGGVPFRVSGAAVPTIWSKYSQAIVMTHKYIMIGMATSAHQKTYCTHTHRCTCAHTHTHTHTHTRTETVPRLSWWCVEPCAPITMCWSSAEATTSGSFAPPCSPTASKHKHTYTLAVVSLLLHKSNPNDRKYASTTHMYHMYTFPIYMQMHSQTTNTQAHTHTHTHTHTPTHTQTDVAQPDHTHMEPCRGSNQ